MGLQTPIRDRGDESVAKRARGGRLSSALRQQFTVMVIPHSERGVVNFHINATVVVILAVVLFVILFGFVYLATLYAGSSAILEDNSERLAASRADMDSVLREVETVVAASQRLDDALSATVEVFGIQGVPTGAEALSGSGDLATFLDVEVLSDTRRREIDQLRTLSRSLEAAVDPLTDIQNTFRSQSALLRDVPNLWPVAGGQGFVTMEFGPNIHPFGGHWYLHKGIDIAGVPGLPIVASANGKVIDMGFDATGYGLNVMIRHKYGFRTRYSHMQRIAVRAGQEVSQGEVIGYLGNTGLSTGPHLDFIVMLGTDVVDPAAFLAISNDFRRGGTGRSR